MSTPHNEAKLGEIAKTVLMPGDPLRAKYIAENFLEDVKQFNGIRNMFGYTGTYKGKRVSVMGSGMGMPSIGIYSYELFHFYDVDRIIRIGSAGSINKDVKLYDLVIANGASTCSSWSSQYGLPANVSFSAVASFDALTEAVNAAKEKGYRYHIGQVLSNDTFYNDPESHWKPFANMGCLAVEMESYALYLQAAQAHKEALCIVTISDSLLSDEQVAAADRVTAFKNMMEVALDCIKE